MTKCTFHKFGSSGEIEKHDAMCILPLNIVNEKIYIFLWFCVLHATFTSGIWIWIWIRRGSDQDHPIILRRIGWGSAGD